MPWRPCGSPPARGGAGRAQAGIDKHPSSAGGTGSESGRRRCRAGGAQGEVLEDLPHERNAVDAVGDRLADELVPERRVAAGTHPDREVIPGRAGGGDDPEPGLPAERGDDTGKEPVRDVELAPPEPLDRVVAFGPEAKDEPVEVGRVGPRELRTSVSWRPRSQRSTRKGPLPIGLPVFGLTISSLQTVSRSSPWSACEGRTPLPKTSPLHPAKRERKTTLTVCASRARTLRTSVRGTLSGAPCFGIAR